jgi:hypothetical protein
MKIKIEDDMRVTYRNNLTGKHWEKWKLWGDCTNEEKELINLRELRKDELVIDDDNNQYDKIISLIEKDNYSEYIVIEANKGNHIHLFFDNISDLDEDVRTEIRRILIKRYLGDESKASERGVISIEERPHFKTNKFCKVIKC